MADSCEIWTPLIHPPVERNKFIFINRNKEHALPKPSTVLINPHFKENKTVFLNPRFQRPTNDNNTQPKVYVNPNILKSVTSEVKTVAINPAFNQNSDIFSNSNYGYGKERFEPQIYAIKNNLDNQQLNFFREVKSNDNRSKLVHTKTKIVNGPQRNPKPSQMVSTKLSTHTNENIQTINQGIKAPGDNQRKLHTRLKIINAPERKVTNPVVIQKQSIETRNNSVFTRFKYVRNMELNTKLPSIAAESLDTLKANEVSRNSRQISELKNTFLRNSHSGTSHEHTKDSVMTRYKYIRNGTKLIKIHKMPLKSKYKIVNNPSPLNKQEKKDRVRVNSSIYRKKYVFLNKYNSSSFLANNVILKNSKQRYSLKINGILYKNSPCLLKKQSSSKSKMVAGGLHRGKQSTRQEIPCKGKYRIVRSNITPVAKLKKCNITCPIYRRTGKCKGLTNGTCVKVHNPDLIILCKSFLRGECQKDNCLLSHKVSSEKMPTCKYFLEGLCNKSQCQYSHVKISPNAEICKEFLEGFCKEGIKCDKRHQFLCPEYERTQQCTKPKCMYPHRHAKSIKPKSTKRNSKKMLQKIDKPSVQKVEDEVSQTRYYKENMENSNEFTEAMRESYIAEAEEFAIPKRKKLGSLPSFIPIS